MFNNWYASNEYVLLHIFFLHSLHFFFFFLYLLQCWCFLQFICNSICKILEAHYKELNRSQGKQWRAAQNWSHPQTNVGSGWIWSIINLFRYKFNNYSQIFLQIPIPLFFLLFCFLLSFFFFLLFIFLKFFVPFLNEKCLTWFDMKKKFKPRKSLGLVTGSCWTLLGSTIYLSVDYLLFLFFLIYKDGFSRCYDLIRWFTWLVYIDLSA